MKNLAKRLLSSRGFVLSRSSRCDVVAKGNPKCAEAVSSVYELMNEFLLTSLPPLSKTRMHCLNSLAGLEVSQAIYFIDLLRETSFLDGAVCEMGVAQGCTSRLIASEIRDSSRHLWLFDSFQGLPEPTAEDELIDDIFGLGSMGAYAGTMREPRQLVEEKLAECDFPSDRTHIVGGFFDETTSSRVQLPAFVSFAFIDFDLYKPIRDVLVYLRDALEPGGCIAIHDYGHFSTGAKTAVDEFFEAESKDYEFQLPHDVARGMAILRKRRDAMTSG